MNKKIVVLAALLCCGIFAYLLAGGKDEETINTELRPISVKIMSVTTARGEHERIYAGIVKPRFESQLAFQIGGKIAERLVDRGDHVEKGQLLMKIDPRDVNLNLQAAQAAADRARSERELASVNLERYSNLFKNDAVSKAQLDEVQNRSNATDAALRHALSNLEEARRQVGYAELKSDYDGVIIERIAEVEQVVAAGQVVLTIQQGEEMDVEINLPEHSIVDIRSNPNVEANASIPAAGSKEFKLSLREISPQADSVTRTYSVKFSMEETEGLASGMTAAVDILWQKDDAPIVIPLSALYRTQGQPDSVWILREDRVFRQAVELGEFSSGVDSSVHVKSGLAAGDKIVIAGAQKLTDGQPAREWTGTSE